MGQATANYPITLARKHHEEKVSTENQTSTPTDGPLKSEEANNATEEESRDHAATAKTAQMTVLSQVQLEGKNLTNLKTVHHKDYQKQKLELGTSGHFFTIVNCTFSPKN